MTDLDPRSLRQAFGRFMTGVTVVTCKTAQGTPVGFTANSFSSVSLDPPLLLVCPGKFLSSYDHFAGCTRFAVNVLAEGQEDVATHFASFKGDRFQHVSHSEDALGNILIDGALARFSCTTHRMVEAGDHAVLLGNVAAFDQTRGRGLGYADGQFFSLGLERTALNCRGRAAICGAIVRQGANILLEATEAGYRPPQVIADDRGNLRDALAQMLRARNQPVSLGPAYSVFDQGEMQCSYVLATTDAPTSSDFEVHPIQDIATLNFASPAIASMMQRFAREAQTRSFGLYIGDAERGDIHHPPERI